MKKTLLTRRAMLKASGATTLALASSGVVPAQVAAAPSLPPSSPLPGDSNRAERMSWWKAARFGMFIHFGVYSTIGRHEWVMEDEAIPVSEYAPHAATFHPREGSPRAWARLAKQ